LKGYRKQGAVLGEQLIAFGAGNAQARGQHLCRYSIPNCEQRRLVAVAQRRVGGLGGRLWSHPGFSRPSGA
jgi:hypothetical protein